MSTFHIHTMKIIKTKLGNKMKGGFLAYNMTAYIERKMVQVLVIYESIVNNFKSLNTRKILF
jgi:hypothetical protein